MQNPDKKDLEREGVEIGPAKDSPSPMFTPPPGPPPPPPPPPPPDFEPDNG